MAFKGLILPLFVWRRCGCSLREHRKHGPPQGAPRLPKCPDFLDYTGSKDLILQPFYPSVLNYSRENFQILFGARAYPPRSFSFSVSRNWLNRSL